MRSTSRNNRAVVANALREGDWQNVTNALTNINSKLGTVYRLNYMLRSSATRWWRRLRRWVGRSIGTPRMLCTWATPRL
jgi:hypothetical protein